MRWIVAVAAIAGALLLSIEEAWPGELQSISLGPLHLAPKERIVGFELRVHSGRIASLPAVPIGWHVTVENEPSWNTRLFGGIVVGAAALDLRFFKDFVVVEKTSSLGLEFRVEGSLVVTDDFVKERHVTLGRGDVLLKAVGRRSDRPGAR